VGEAPFAASVGLLVDQGPQKFASSAESVGELWLGKVTEVV
jgi:hypothetical protein